MTHYKHPFEPFVPTNAKIVILGSFPSIASFENNFYYAHPQNQFWKLLSGVFMQEIPKTLTQKKEFLTHHKIALWDMVASCARQNSLDSNLKNIQVNDIAFFLKQNPTITKVCFTGKKAQQLYEKQFKSLDVEYCYLPSPSPAYRAMSFEKKLAVYKEKLLG